MSRKRLYGNTGNNYNTKSIQHTIQDLNTALVLNGRAAAEGPKRKTWSSHDLKVIKPLTSTQESMYRNFFSGNNICATGCAGVGKSFVALYLALCELLNKSSMVDKIIIVRSAVPTREIGYLPGSMEEKLAVYELPYHDMFREFLNHHNSYQDMKDAGLVQFYSSSFVRGLSWNNAVVVIDEAQNMTWQELDSIITRVGTNSRIIICGDSSHQQDLKRGEQTGFHIGIRVMHEINSFSVLQFSQYDIVRSDFVKQWIIARNKLDL